MKIDLNISQKQAVNLLRFLYPLWALVGLFSIAYIPSKFIVSGDAIVTANNIIANGLLFRLGIAGNLLTHLIHIIVVLILYQLFKSVDKKQAMLIVILGLIGVPIAMFNEVFKAAALLLINNPEQMMFFLDLHGMGIIIASVFWGLWLIPQGMLIYKSGYFPKIFGHLMIIAGVAYTTMAFVQIIFPHLTTVISMLEMITMGEVLFMIWVLFKGAKLSGDGVDVEKMSEGEVVSFD
ncbi:DUF4386 domain-containing protein [archaeon]|jgi:hypothetical protein|nr:DUF4386 domain-containing protein [archaeon]